MAGSLPIALIAFNSVSAQIIGHAPADAKLSIPQLGLHAVADSGGHFRFDSVSDGRWVIELRAPDGVALTLANVRHGAATVTLASHAICANNDTTPVAAGARPGTLSWRPAQPAPGTLITLTTSGDSIESIWGRVADEPVTFRRDTGNAFVALAAVPLDVTTVHAALKYRYAGGQTAERDTVLGVTAPPPAVVASAARPEKLKVAAEFSRPATSNVTRRIDGESELAHTVGAISLATPPLWRQPFMRPRASRITSGFASGRKFNGTLTSRHTGVDFRGKIGDPVRATNRGVVALVADFYLAGTVVYIAHGAGLVSGYFHLSATPVAIGDTVQRGQIIGRVGQSGRVTGPHLHWIIRYDHTTVDPLGVLSLGWVPKRDYGTCRGPD
jgi:murein DD-endopeptidase MepM/ murein hydrolase activator NlpD